MLFQITRASMWSDEKPHDKCFLIAKDPYIGHRWGVEINSLEELMAFKAEVDEPLIIGLSLTDEKMPNIEIYDDYRE